MFQTLVVTLRQVRSKEKKTRVQSVKIQLVRSHNIQNMTKLKIKVNTKSCSLPAGCFGFYTRHNFQFPLLKYEPSHFPSPAASSPQVLMPNSHLFVRWFVYLLSAYISFKHQPISDICIQFISPSNIYIYTYIYILLNLCSQLKRPACVHTIQ